MIERIINSKLKVNLMNNNLIDHEQKGLLPKKRTTCSLYRLKIEYEILARDGKKAALIHLDLEIAFDSVGTMGCCSNFGHQ